MGMATGQQPPMPGQAKRAPGSPLQGGRPMMPQGGPPRAKQAGAMPPNPAQLPGMQQKAIDLTKMQGMPGYGAPRPPQGQVNLARMQGMPGAGAPRPPMGPTNSKTMGAKPPQYRR